MSKLSENARMALVALMTNKLRALLTTIGIGFGIAAVIVLVSLGNAVQGYLTRQFLSVGSDLIYVRSAPTGNGFGQRVGRSGVELSSLTSKDVSLLSDPFNVPNVKEVVPLIEMRQPAVYGNRTEQRASIYATTANYFDVLNRQLASGRLLDDQDEQTTARVAVIGQTTASNLFTSDVDPVGETIRVGSVPFKIVGTLQTSGGSSFGADQDNLIIVPISAAQAHLDTQKSSTGELPISQIYLQASSIDTIDDSVTAATESLRAQHKIKAGTDDDFQVTAQKDLLDNFQQTISTLTIFLAVIGGISLVVGGIGVMNIMLVTVTERTREVGLRKAVGARNWDVLLQFLTEAIVLCFVGGVAGLSLAVAVTYIVGALVPSLEPAVSVTGVALAISITTLIGIFFGLYPASRAAALSPIQALRTE
jgi:putative ABC transport system permease protein